MRIPQSYIQQVKVAGHAFQAIFIFIAACFTFSVLARSGPTGGATQFFIALCFLSIIPIIYLSMTPMWSRAQRFANAYAFLVVDGLFTLLWFIAFIAVAMWNSSGITGGAADKKIPAEQANCTTFKYGSEGKCSASKNAVGVGIGVFILFAITTAISGYYFYKFRKEGILPYESTTPNPHHLSGETSKDNAWSTEIEPRHRDSTDSVDRHTDHGGNQHDDEYALLNSTETDEGRHPGRPLSWGDDRTGGYGRPAPPYADYRDEGRGSGADALSPGGYEEYRHDGTGAPHKQAGSGYSFSRN